MRDRAPADEAVSLWLNGEAREVPEGDDLGSLLDRIGVDHRAVAIERNGAIVRRSDYRATRLEAGDRVEIVRFVQGG